MELEGHMSPVESFQGTVMESMGTGEPGAAVTENWEINGRDVLAVCNDCGWWSRGVDCGQKVPLGLTRERAPPCPPPRCWPCCTQGTRLPAE